MPKSGRKAKSKSALDSFKIQEQAARRSDDLREQLQEFAVWQEEILPALRRDLLAGMSAQDLRRKYAAIAQARTIMTVMTDPDAAKALAASRDILDREEGKAKERQEVTHRLEKLPEEQLDALLLSELEEVEIKKLGDLPN